MIARERDGDAAAAEVDERDQGFGGVKAEGAVADQADLAVEAFVARIGEAEADGGWRCRRGGCGGCWRAGRTAVDVSGRPRRARRPGALVRGRGRAGGRAAGVLRAAGRRGGGGGGGGELDAHPLGGAARVRTPYADAAARFVVRGERPPRPRRIVPILWINTPFGDDRISARGAPPVADARAGYPSARSSSAARRCSRSERA